MIEFEITNINPLNIDDENIAIVHFSIKEKLANSNYNICNLKICVNAKNQDNIKTITNNSNEETIKFLSKCINALEEKRP